MTQDTAAGNRIIVSVKLPTTSELFKKHFNDMGQAGLFHPNTEVFFNDLNDVCKIEDSLKQINHPSNPQEK